MPFSSDQIFIAAFVLQSVSILLLAAEIISDRKQLRDPTIHDPVHAPVLDSQLDGDDRRGDNQSGRERRDIDNDFIDGHGKTSFDVSAIGLIRDGR